MRVRHNQGEQGFRGGRYAEPAAPDGDGKFNEELVKAGVLACRRGAPPDIEGKARALRSMNSRPTAKRMIQRFLSPSLTDGVGRPVARGDKVWDKALGRT